MADELKMLWGAFVLVTGVAFSWLARLQARVSDGPLQYITRVEAQTRFADLQKDIEKQEERMNEHLRDIKAALLRIEGKLDDKADKV